MLKFKHAVSGWLVGTMMLAVAPAFAAGAEAPPALHGGSMGSGMMPGHPGPGGWHHCLMRKGGWRNAPVPMLMPMVWRHAVDLKLTPAQETDLQNWRARQKKAMSAWRHHLQAHNTALRDALLRGAPGNTIAPLRKAVLKDHATMLEHGIQQARYLHKILTPAQWHQITTLYKAKEAKREH
ncbi:hypothetical protein [Acidithiobacillus ferrianus]|uniref:hypothetical protein n=1 Tax=Acidithiobacillus ferrianus TaxID=2678518 RepID=UPI0034E52593